MIGESLMTGQQRSRTAQGINTPEPVIYPIWAGCGIAAFVTKHTPFPHPKSVSIDLRRPCHVKLSLRRGRMPLNWGQNRQIERDMRHFLEVRRGDISPKKKSILSL